MSDTRAQLDTYIDTNISDKTTPDSLTPENEGDALKRVATYADGHKAVTVFDDEASTNVLTASNTDFEYSLTFWRCMNTIHVSGIIRNSTGSDALTARNIAAIATAWQPESSVLPFRYTADDSAVTPNQMRINITATHITLATDIDDQNDHFVNISYPANV